jgi:hypothetical protein
MHSLGGCDTQNTGTSRVLEKKPIEFRPDLSQTKYFGGNKKEENLLMIKMPTPGTRIMTSNLTALQRRVFTDGIPVPAARERRPSSVVLCCKARKSTNLALAAPCRQIIAHLIRSSVVEIVADNETPANSEKVRRKNMAYPRERLNSVKLLVKILPLACRQVNTKRLSVRRMSTEP